MTGLWAAALWGLAEGTVFFVVPDVLFTLTTLFSPKRGLLQLGAAVAGAVVAGAIMYAWAAAAPAQARAAVSAVPFVGEKVIAPAEQRWDEEGLPALFNRPLGGVPYKVHAVLAPARLSMAEFLLVSVPMRVERMILSWMVFATAAWIISRLGERRPFDRLRAGRRPAAWSFYALFWTALYAVYWSANA